MKGSFMNANEQQIGGQHYSSEYQHWDWAIDCKLGYLEGAATKYIARWRKKNGIEDLKKARHYIQKLCEIVEFDTHCPEGENLYPKACEKVVNIELGKTVNFCVKNKLNPEESEVMMIMASWAELEEINKCLSIIDSIIQSETNVS